MRYKIITYNPATYPFSEIVRKLFHVDHLAFLHRSASKEYPKQFEIGMDSSTEFHQKFYDKYRSGWPELVQTYEGFIATFISKIFGEPFLYQKFPTFRVHLPDHVAVGAFHKDADFGHPEGEVNYILPLTSANNTSSVWVESEPGKQDFQPMPMLDGQLIEFNGNHLTHGNKVNLTGMSRVSMDFRILPFSKYRPSKSDESITTHRKYVEGDYYKKFQL